MTSPGATLRVLFIGNSFTQRNDLPGLVGYLLAAGTPPCELVAERVIANGASLRQHWNAGTACRLIREGPWDAVVLQEQSTLPLKNRQRYHENVRLFHDVIREQGARTVLYLTWARRDAPHTQSDLTEAVLSIAGETGALVAPVGPAWERVRQEGTGPELYDKDGSHPTPAGSYLAACVFSATLLGRNPQGLPTPEGLRLSPAETGLLQTAAWQTVQSFGR